MNKIRKVIYSLITLSLVFSSLNLNVLAFEDPDATDDKVTVNINIGENSEGLSVESATIQVQRGDIPSESDYGIKYQAYWKLSGFKVNSGTNLRKDFNTVQFLDDVNTITFYGFPDRNGNDRDDRVENLMNELNPQLHERFTIKLNSEIGNHVCVVENVQSGQEYKVVGNFLRGKFFDLVQGQVSGESELVINNLEDAKSPIERIECIGGNDDTPLLVNVYYNTHLFELTFKLRENDQGNIFIDGPVATVAGSTFETTNVEVRNLPEGWKLDGFYYENQKITLTELLTTPINKDKEIEVRTYPDTNDNGTDDREETIFIPLPNTNKIKMIYTTGEGGQNLENSCSIDYDRTKLLHYEVNTSYIYQGKTYTSTFFDAIADVERNGIIDINNQSLFKGRIPSINPKSMNCHVRDKVIVIDLNFDVDETGKRLNTHIMTIDVRRGDKGTLDYSSLPYYQESENSDKYFLISDDLFFGKRITWGFFGVPGWKIDGFYVNGVKKEIDEIITMALTQNVEVELRTFPDDLNNNGIDDRIEQGIYHTVTYRNVRNEIIHEVRVRHGENAPAFGYNEEANNRPYGKNFCGWSAEAVNVVEDMNLRPIFCPQILKIEAYYGDTKTEDNTLDLNLDKPGKIADVKYGETVIIKDAEGKVFAKIVTRENHVVLSEEPNKTVLISQKNSNDAYEVKIPEARFSGWRYFDGWKIEKIANDIVLSPIVREKITNPIVQPQPQPQPKPEINVIPKPQEETTTPSVTPKTEKPKPKQTQNAKPKDTKKELDKKAEGNGEIIKIDIPKDSSGVSEIKGFESLDVEVGKEISFKDESGNVIETIKVDKNTKLKLPKAPKVEGKLFKGWKAEKDNQGNIIIIAYYEDVKIDEVKPTETKVVEKEDTKSSFPVILGLSGLGLTGLLILFVVFLKKKNKEDELKFQNKFENKDVDVNNSDFFDME